MKEIWMSIPGLGNHYQASNLGQIRSVDRTIDHKRNGKTFYKGKVLAQSMGSRGYFVVTLTFKGKSKGYTVHRLVMYAFHGIRADMMVNHRNGIKSDNSLTNLEYCTPSENNKHAYNIGLKKPAVGSGSKNSNASLTPEQVKEIRLKYSKGGVFYKTLATEFGVCHDTIKKIVTRKSYISE